MSQCAFHLRTNNKEKVCVCMNINGTVWQNTNIIQRLIHKPQSNNMKTPKI